MTSRSEEPEEKSQELNPKLLNNKIFDVIWNVSEDPFKTRNPDDQKPEMKTRRRNYDIVQEYSEYSTVAGLLYVFMRDQVYILTAKVLQAKPFFSTWYIK